MRSIWSADRALALVAAATMEAAWLTLVYAFVQWAAHADLVLGIGQFAVSAGIGVLLARRLKHWPSRRFVGALTGVALIFGGIGVWLAVGPSTTLADLSAALARHPGGWLLALAVVRGTAHADPDDESIVAERVLGRGVASLIAFWILATLTGFVHAPRFEAVAFTATLSFVTAGLVSMGAARLNDLDVESSDPARTKWLGLVLGVCALVLVVGVPLAVVLGLPLDAALSGVIGPLAPLLAVLTIVLTVPIVLLLGGLASLLDLVGGRRAIALPTPIASAAASGAGHSVPQTGAPDLSLLLWLAIAAGAVLMLLALATFVRRPTADGERPTGVELREAEPIVLGPLLRMPRFRLPAMMRRSPTSAEEAYRMALASLVGSDMERRRGETPKEHSRRVADSTIGRGLGRLAADYQISALARRRLTAAEERRALDRWRAISRESHANR